MTGHLKALVLAMSVAVMGGAHAHASEGVREVTFSVPLKASFSGGDVRVYGTLRSQRSTCVGAPISLDVRAEDPAFFTEGSDDLEAMVNEVGAAIRAACTSFPISRVHLQLRSVDADDRIIATAEWRGGFDAPTDGQITDFHPTRASPVWMATPESDWLDDDASEPRS